MNIKSSKNDFPGYASNLLNLSLAARIGIQLVLAITLVFIPYFFPDIIYLQNSQGVTVNVILSLGLNIVFEIFKNLHKANEKKLDWVLNTQLVVNTVLLTWFLHVFDRINGPLFILYPFLIIESAFLSRRLLQNFVFGFTSLSVILEFFWLIFSYETELTLYSFLLLFIRLMVLFLMRSYGSMLANKLFEDGETAEDLSTMNKKLKDIDKNKDEFIYMAAHELRSPVSAIKGYVSMILEGDTGEIPTKARGYLADVNNINDRLIRLINNMLNVSKIEEGKLVYQMDHENLSEIVRSVFGQFMPETERKNLDYNLEIPRNIKDMVFVDSDKVQEVMGNLISNAVKYTDKGSVVVRLKMSGEKRVRFEVQDSGVGIAKDEQNKLFQKFHRVESNVGKTTGSGLGLYISKLLIEKFKGKIGVDSEFNKGSTFWFDLPLSTP